ncbi:MAG: 4a-hydroxytetrahydrobiopterin dehydratase [Gammaproteobacteria bacterium]|nr:4a-hydroxytetrahydrobiopterin dehydratase [Gammaproteobacteria bacterium]|tara:strand:- start:268 stop:609 length:342 start_codon:yes stop_codon:yes gene_type:complete
MTDLLKKKCTACEVGAPLVSKEDQILLLKDLDGWEIDNLNVTKLVKLFKLSNYQESIRFTNLIAELAELEDHHPKIILKWGQVGIEWWSHKIKGLHMNDFICAAKSDEIYKKI